MLAHKRSYVLLDLKHWAKGALFWVANWVVFVGLWLLYTSSPKISELFAGMGAAIFAATGSTIVQQQGFALFVPRTRWVLLALAEPWYVLTGSFAIIWALLRHIAGRPSKAELKTIPFDSGGDDHRSSARRTLATVLTTIPPNFIVVGIDRSRNLMLIHQVSPTGTPWLTKQLGAKE